MQILSGGSDYVPHINTPLTISAGSPIGTLSCTDVIIENDDKVEELSETFTVVLSSDGPVDFTVSNGFIFILDDDSKNIHLYTTWCHIHMHIHSYST